ncbi:MAG: DUF512 domain-containing protein [Acidaminococcaceae bacterium]|nr:DUF512 domain-containing protein [Acidaminococcaceae bacterium]
MAALITKVQPHSLAADAGIEVGEELVGINGLQIKDIIELSYLQSDTCVEVQLIKNGMPHNVTIKKHPDEELGLEFASAVFDKIKTCQNKCVFCFVDQMIEGRRQGLYVKDDDFRLSFLYGNFLTLTNLQEADFRRIVQMHLSPLYVSVHATDKVVRCKMMNNRFAGDILEKLKKLIDGGINIHTQIVCCPEYNDGKVLEQTFKDLMTLYPGVQSMGIVPVGLTKNREHLTALRTFTVDEAKKICKTVSKWQKQCCEKFGKNFVYLADEFYLLAGLKIPDALYYDGFPQLENGIGLTRVFLDDWEKEIKNISNHSTGKAVIPVGEAAYKVLAPLMQKLNKQIGGEHQFIVVKNEFFGGAVNVTGLLAATDILQATKKYKRVILPEIVLNKNKLFLDDVSFTEFEKKHGGSIQVAANAKALLQLLVER